MIKYLLDTNVIINLWNNNEKFLDRLLKEDKIVILNEVLNELSIKETKMYRRKEVLSARFCRLLPYSIEVLKENISGFYMIFDCEGKGKFEKNNLSEIDMLQLYSCYIDDSLKLVTEDKVLYNIGKCILGEERVISIENLFNIYLYKQ